MIDILVFTCAQYADVIHKHLIFFERFWTLPYYRLTYIVAGTHRISVPRKYNVSKTRFFSMVEDNGLSATMLEYLRDKTEPFMMMMDDHILFSVSENLVHMAWEIIHRPDVGCVRLVPWPGPTLPHDVDGFGEIDKTLEYSISLQASMWKPQTFLDLLDRSWNPWQIEGEGSKRVAAYGKRFIGCKTCAVNYKDYYCRGKPRPEHSEWVDEHLRDE